MTEKFKKMPENRYFLLFHFQFLDISTVIEFVSTFIIYFVNTIRLKGFTLLNIWVNRLYRNPVNKDVNVKIHLQQHCYSHYYLKINVDDYDICLV
jgi:hypothetical protein